MVCVKIYNKAIYTIKIQINKYKLKTNVLTKHLKTVNAFKRKKNLT